jgi:hypothetical protein
MAKIIRLTESDLTRLVRRVIQEQKLEKLPNVIKIRVGNDLTDLDTIIKDSQGCYFQGSHRGSNKNFDKTGVKYFCNVPKQVNNDTPISDAADKLLSDACGCSEYVKNQKSSGSSYV